MTFPGVLRQSLLVATTAALLGLPAAAQESFHRSLSSSAEPDIYVTNGSGSIRIGPGSGSQVEITGHVHSGWNSFGNVRSRVSEIVNHPPIAQSGNSIHIGETHDRSLFNNITIDYEISVPTQAALNLHTGSGDIEVRDVGRFLLASTGSGSLRASGVHGNADLESGSGDIELTESGTGDVKARTGSGSLRVHGLAGRFTARTGSGDVELSGRLSGESRISTGSGSIRLHLDPSLQANLEASTGSGDIRVHLPGISETTNDKHHMTLAIHGGGPALELRTGSGDIELTAR